MNAENLSPIASFYLIIDAINLDLMIHPKQLHSTLNASKTAALAQPQAISGLGGIGKTQTAVEYAYRYRDEYRYVLWARADTREALVSDFITIASLLKLPEKDAQDQSMAIAAVKRWLQEHGDWLLI